MAILRDFRPTDLIYRHPLAFVLAVAILARIPAVIWSKGYMASDDYYETVDIAYDWLRTGPLNDDGQLTWRYHESGEISRFPLYTLTLYALMKLHVVLGVSSLDAMMYAIRALHAMLSLITVWGLFVIVHGVTRSTGWAVIAGLAGGLHFAMPYLGVRTLIEMVSGHLWLAALVLLYRYSENKRASLLVWAGVMTGLAWMTRFQIAAAAVPVPLLLWWQDRSFRPALAYAAGGLAMVLIAGLADWILIGKWLGTFINHVAQGLAEGELYRTPRLIYPIVLMALGVFPLSVVAAFWASRKHFWRNHLILATSLLSFVIFHTLASNRQERFMLPVLGAFLLLLILAVAHRWCEPGRIPPGRWFTWIAYPSVVINLGLLVLLTATYSHKGEVEPLVQIERVRANPHIVFVSPERPRIYPMNYGGLAGIQRSYIHTWGDFARNRDMLTDADTLEFFVLYPEASDRLEPMVDSVEHYFGPVLPWRHIEPSGVDRLLHLLNPKHNRLNEVFVYRPGRS